MKITNIVCDICKKWATHEHKSLQVIFTTEQDEGRSSKPYLDTAHVDLCGDCQAHLLKGNYIFAAGAMGYNDYHFKTAPGERGGV